MTDKPDPKTTIGELFGAYVEPGHRYPSELPADLTPWHAYFADAGHSIIVALADSYEPGADPATFLCPAPVKAVQRVGWTMRDSYVVCDLPYDPNLGLITEEGDDEFDQGSATSGLGEWMATQRARHDAGELPTEPIEALQALDEHGKPRQHAYRVGQLYNPNRTSWPEVITEASQLILSPTACMFILFYRDPRNEEVEAIARGPARFALVTMDELLLFLYRFDHADGTPCVDWADAVWEAGRQTTPPPGVPGRSGTGRHLLLHVVLVDAGNGIIRANRLLTLSPQMTDALRNAVQAQLTAGYHLERAEQRLNELYTRYGHSKNIVRQRAEVTCKGGVLGDSSFIE